MVGEDGNLSAVELADLAAFADGSLPARRQAKVSAAVERSPQLQALVEEQRDALAAVRAVDVSAPPALHARVQAERRRQGRPRWRGFALAGGLATAMAAAALLAVLVLPGGHSGAPTVAETADLAQRGPSAPAPPQQRREPNLLAASVAGVPFPDYRAMFGWRASGARADDLDGRATRTVFYDREGRRIAYTIVSGAKLDWPANAPRTSREGVQLRYLRSGATNVVTWLRGDHTCVLSGTGVARGELLELAAWKGKGTIPF
jgi:hypothetical protein